MLHGVFLRAGFHVLRSSAVHLSILFSIIRIVQPGSFLRQFAYFSVAYFVVCWSILVSAKVWQCASNATWVHQPFSPGCAVTSPILIFETTCERVPVIFLRIIYLPHNSGLYISRDTRGAPFAHALES